MSDLQPCWYCKDSVDANSVDFKNTFLDLSTLDIHCGCCKRVVEKWNKKSEVKADE